MEKDLPIEKNSGDKLRRERFIKAIVSNIIENKTNDCFVIGLYGKWGTGKSSIINLLNEELNNKGYFTAYFNPWIYKSEDILLTELFKTILKGARINHKNSKKLGKFLLKYSKFFVAPRVMIKGAWFDLAKPVRELFEHIGTGLIGDESAEKQKEEVNKILRQLAVPLVIFIDDIDRLDKSEIQFIFKIIKLTANFNRLIYVVAFDDDIVAKSIAHNYGAGNEADGRDFLEKIIQLPIRIPHLNNNDRFEYTLNLLENHTKDIKRKYPKELHDNFLSQFNMLHNNFIKTPRDSKRLINAVTFSHKCLEDEICYFDLILLELLRIFAPLAFDFLLSNKFYLFLNELKLSDTKRDDDNEATKHFKELAKYYTNGYYSLEHAIGFLFPSNAIYGQSTGNFRNASKDDLIKYQRVGFQKYFDRYIEFKIGKDDISDIQLKEILKNINTLEYKEASVKMKILINFDRDNILSQLWQFQDLLNELGKCNLAIELNINAHYFKERSFLARTHNRATKLTLELFSKITNEKRLEILQTIVDTSPDLHYLAEFLWRLEQGYGQEGELKFQPENEFQTILKNFAIRLNALDARLFFPDDEKNDITFSMIEKFCGLDDLREKLFGFIKADNRNLLLFIKSLLSVAYGGLRNGNYNYDIDASRFQAIERYVPREVLLNSCTELYPDLENDLPLQTIHQYDYDDDRNICLQYYRFSKFNNSQGKKKTI